MKVILLQTKKYGVLTGRIVAAYIIDEEDAKFALGTMLSAITDAGLCEDFGCASYNANDQFTDPLNRFNERETVALKQDVIKRLKRYV